MRVERGAGWVLTGLAALLLWGSPPAEAAEPSYKILNHSGGSHPSSTAKALVAPSQDNYALTIRRIRITTGASTTSPSYIFASMSTADPEGETESLSSCALPSCFEVLAAESVKRDMVFDYRDIDLYLPVGHRLYVYATADIGSEAKHATIEVWYDEHPSDEGMVRWGTGAERENGARQGARNGQGRRPTRQADVPPVRDRGGREGRRGD